MMFFPGIFYLGLFVAVFFLPGFSLTAIMGIKRFRFLLSCALSYSLLVLTLLPFEYFARPIVSWERCILSVWVILSVWTVARIFIVRKNIQHSTSDVQPKTNGLKFDFVSRKLNAPSFRRLLISRLLVPCLLAAIVCGYLVYAGPYLEIPSDVWTHVFRFQWQKITVMVEGVFPPGLSWDTLFLHNTFYYWYFNPWYFIHAWLCHISGLSIMDSLSVLTFLNVTAFLLGFYYFGLFLFAGLRITAFEKIVMAALTALFAAASMGNMVFAYIRYYAFAPAILNYILFLAAMALIVDWLRCNRWFGHALWIVPLLIIISALIHTQEALFIFFMTLVVGLAETIRIFWRKVKNRPIYCLWKHMETMKALPTPTSGHPSKGGELISIPSREGQGGGGKYWNIRNSKHIILTASLLLVFFAAFAAIRYLKPVPWISSNMIMPQTAIPTEPVNFIFQKLLLSPPENPWLRLIAYQLFVFYQVVGLWGLFVYSLFFLMLRRFVRMPYLLAGMLSPFLTAFNPLLVDMFVRMGQDPTLYRFYYMIPLPFIAGYLFVHFLGKSRDFFRQRSGINFFGCTLLVAGLAGLLLPINCAGIYAPYSKMYTVLKTPADNDCRLWRDLGMMLEKQKGKIVLTDPYTRFMMNYSPKNECAHTAWLASRTPEKDRPEPYTWESLRGRGIIIMNRRDGALSVTGKISGHWPKDVLKVNRYYSPEVEAYLDSHPEMFQKIWAQNRIAIYAVR